MLFVSKAFFFFLDSFFLLFFLEDGLGVDIDADIDADGMSPPVVVSALLVVIPNEVRVGGRADSSPGSVVIPRSGEKEESDEVA